MNKFLRDLITEWRRLGLPVEDATFVVAVSGGADSVSLLLALAELKQKKKLATEFVAAHFNHALRGKESDKDEEFVKKLAEKLGLKFESARWKTTQSKTTKAENLEQAARDARYAFLKKTAEKHEACAVLTGHTMNDQAETFLLRLIRGSGPDGLGAMPVVRDLAEDSDILLVRPLLNWAARADTEGFCRIKKIKYRNDPMNEDESFLRVKVRRNLIPLLQALNPAIIPNLAQLSGLVREEAAEIDTLARMLASKACNISKGTIEVKQIQALSPAIRRRILRLWLEDRRGDLRRLGMKHFAAVERLVLHGTGGKRVELPGGEEVTLTKGRLIFKRTKVEKSPPGN